MSWWAETLRALRMLTGISQKELGRRAGFAASQICEYETGRREPRVSTFDQLIGAMGYRVTIEAEKEGDEHD